MHEIRKCCFTENCLGVTQGFLARTPSSEKRFSFKHEPTSFIVFDCFGSALDKKRKNEHISGNTWHKITVQTVKCSVVKDETVNFTFFDAQLIFQIYFPKVKSTFPFGTSQLVLLFFDCFGSALDKN